MEEEQLVMLDEDMGRYVAAGTPLAQLTRLLQFASASAVLDEAGRVRLSSPSSKVDDLLEVLEEMGEKPLVVASVSRQLVELASSKLTQRGISHGLITGKQSAWERQEAVDTFQKGKMRAVLMTLGAGAEGITLTRSDTILFMNESWRQLENTQAIGRIDRIGAEQHACLNIIKQITPGTVEERKISVLAGKDERFEEVFRDAETIRRLLGEDGQ
jgi:SNF2 family DNA or RNA helicase